MGGPKEFAARAAAEKYTLLRVILQKCDVRIKELSVRLRVENGSNPLPYLIIIARPRTLGSIIMKGIIYEYGIKRKINFRICIGKYFISFFPIYKIKALFCTAFQVVLYVVN